MTLEALKSIVPSLWLARAAFFAFGAIWGSFLNVVIYRVPREMSVVRPASRCPACEKPIAGYDNIPIVSYLVLRGRARCCGARMSPRYVFVELIGAALSLTIFEVVLRGLPSDTLVLRASAIYVADLAFCLSLVAAAFIDLEHMLLPDTITIGGTILGVATSSFRDMGFLRAIIGAASGFVMLWLPMEIYKRVRKKTGMGLGDAKLMMLAGAWFGWLGALVVLFAGSFQGTIGALVVYVVQGKIEEPEEVRKEREELEKAAAEGDEEAKQMLEEDPIGKAPEVGKSRFKNLMGSRMPFGPFLILACLEYLFVGPWIVERYFSLFVGL
jgi:leader peptidase (prepilin peptidase)/N-methyltransferase